MSKTFANGITVVHKGDGLQFVGMAPDVCKTPSPGGPIPVPYPNLALSSDLAAGSQTVKLEGNPAALSDSNLKTSTGNEAGTAGGGIVSGKIKGKVKWILYSTDVKFEGKGVVRFQDDFMYNGNSGNGPGKNFGYPGPSRGKDIKCDNCGKSIDDPSHNNTKMHRSKETDQEAEALANKVKHGKTEPMSCVVTSQCPGGTTGMFKGVAGQVADGRQTLIDQNTIKKLYANFAKPNKPLNAAKLPTEQNAPGNCAEQKALYKAYKDGMIRPGCVVNMSVYRAGKGAQISCVTCQRILTSMLCTN